MWMCEHLLGCWRECQRRVCSVLQKILKNCQVWRMRMVCQAGGSVQRRPALASVPLVDLSPTPLDQELHAAHLHTASSDRVELQLPAYILKLSDEERQPRPVVARLDSLVLQAALR